MRPLFALGAIGLLLLGGCVKKHADKDKKKKDEPLPIQSVAVGAGDTTVYQSSDPSAPISFTLAWTTGGFKSGKDGVETGHLELPKGEIYQDGKPASTYRADKGEAVRSLKRLDMKGAVTLRSIDRTQTLTSDTSQYRGDVKIIRAMGNVTAKGPFGTLSGEPELWATPDFKLIGTPDMVSKALKIPALTALAASAAAGGGMYQKDDEIQMVSKHGPALLVRTATGYRSTIQPPKDGPLVILLPSRGLKFTLTGATTFELDKDNLLHHLSTKAPLNVVQTKPGSLTTLDGSSAEYNLNGATTGDLSLGGRVTIVTTTNSKGKMVTTTSRGDRGSAVLYAKPPEGANALKSARLDGNVTIDSQGSPDGTFSGRGDHMEYVPGKETAVVTLDGHAILKSVTKESDGSRTIDGRGARGQATLLNAPAAGASPMKTAVLEEGVNITVTGSNGQTMNGRGDRLVYTASDSGGRAVMTGNLKFTGDLPTFLGDFSGADTATVVIGPAGWETIETNNTGGTPTRTTIHLKPQPAKTPAPPKKGKKGGKP